MAERASTGRERIADETTHAVSRLQSTGALGPDEYKCSLYSEMVDPGLPRIHVAGHAPSVHHLRHQVHTGDDSRMRPYPLESVRI